MTKLVKTLFLATLAVGLLVIGVYLFAGDEIQFYLENTNLYTYGASDDEKDLLRIGYSLAAPSLDPTQFNVAARQYMVDTYEGLVKTDKDLNIETGLAISWGVTRDNIWEFRLRPDVKFHDGSPMTSDDVVYSINLAKSASSSELKNLLETISAVKVLSGDKIQLETSEPDPLLLNKLATVYIVPDQYSDFDKPMGTGPYKFVEHEGSVMKLVRFDDHWDRKTVYRNVELHVIPGRKDRIAALEDGAIDILGNVPPNVACSLTEDYASKQGCSLLKSSDILVETIPSLEVSFIMLNFENELLKDVEIRNAFRTLFDYNVFKDLAFGFTVQANQFVSNGVFGYSPEIEDVEYDLDSAKEVIGNRLGGNFDRPLLTFDYPVGLEPIGIYVRDQLREVGVDVQLNPLSPAALESKIKSGESDFYFFGWKSELGDSADFLFSVAHSKARQGFGLFNGINYSNQKVDSLLQKSRGVMDPAKRIRPLQDAMELVVEEDVIGIPLYESEVIYSFNKSVNFIPRIDGYIMAAEIK